MYSILSLSVCISTTSNADQRTIGAEKLEGRLVVGVLTDRLAVAFSNVRT